RLAPMMGERQETQAERHRQGADQLGNAALALRARRCERDDLVLADRRFGEAGERATQVVADPGRLVGERADIERDLHLTPNRMKRIPSRRVSVLPGMTRAGTRVRGIRKRTVHEPRGPRRSGTRMATSLTGPTSA